MNGPARILVVEDEAIVARDIRQQLVELGHEAVGYASRGEEVIPLVEQLKPDLVLMDIQLAGEMDGITVAQSLRERFHVPVVFLTAFAADEFLARAKLSQPYGYLLKPFYERELKSALEMALYKASAEAHMRQNALELQQLSRRVLEVQEAERRRIALELHDQLGQALTSIKINLQLRERLGEHAPAHLLPQSVALVDDAIQQVRELALALRPAVLDDLGLGSALEWLVQQRQGVGGLTLDFENARDTERADPVAEIAAYRITQEALTNVLRHAGARRVEIRLAGDAHELLLEVHDDGQGFDPASVAAASAGGQPRGLGLVGMRERAALAGGSLEIASAPGKGCTLRFECPMQAPERAA